MVGPGPGEAAACAEEETGVVSMVPDGPGRRHPPQTGQGHYGVLLAALVWEPSPSLALPSPQSFLSPIVQGWRGHLGGSYQDPAQTQAQGTAPNPLSGSSRGHLYFRPPAGSGHTSKAGSPLPGARGETAEVGRVLLVSKHCLSRPT